MSTALDDPSIGNDPAPTGDPAPAPAPADPAPAPAPAADPAPAPEPGPAFGENWRQELAGEDEKFLKQLGRFSSPNDLAKAYREAQTKISAGEAKALPENPTDEQLAEWRESQGIPATPSDYSIELSDGLVIGDDDKAMVDGYLEAMHGTNATQEQITAGLESFYKMREAEIAQLEVQDNTDRDTAIQALRDEWGPDYQSNQNALRSLMNQIPEAAREQFMNARMADGTAMMNNAGMLQFFADLSRKTNPAATVVPNADNPAQAIGDEMKQIEGWMKNNDDKYWKDETVQARYRDLITAKEGM